MSENEREARDNEHAGQPTRELNRRHDRSSDDATTEGQAESPVDSMHVDAPTRQKNVRGHRRVPERGS